MYYVLLYYYNKILLLSCSSFFFFFFFILDANIINLFNWVVVQGGCTFYSDANLLEQRYCCLIKKAVAIVQTSSRKIGSNEVEDANEFAKLTTDYSDFQRDTIKSSSGRWFVLLVFCMVSMCQAMTWMLLGPSSREFTRAYGNTVDSSYISWATNAANISFLLFTWPNKTC